MKKPLVFDSLTETGYLIFSASFHSVSIQTMSTSLLPVSSVPGGNVNSDPDVVLDSDVYSLDAPLPDAFPARAVDVHMVGLSYKR